MSHLKTVEHAKYVVEHRFELAQKAKLDGRIVIGHYCSLFEKEILTAAGVYPFRIGGNVHEMPTEVDRVLETTMCPFIRSTVDMAMKGNYDFLDALVVPHACECMEKMFDIWPFYVDKIKHVFMLDIPHMVYADDSFDFYTVSIRAITRNMNIQMGLDITEEKLRAAIVLHNENRGLLQALYELRKADIPPISAEEVYYLVHAGDFMGVEDHNKLLKEAIAEIKSVKISGKTKRPRILLHMAQLDDPELLTLIDECGGEVVADDMCIGSRSFNFMVDESKEPYSAMAYAYLSGINCPRTCRVDKPDNRFDHIIEMAKDSNASGVILFITRYCDTYAYDVPLLRNALEDAGLSVLHLEEEYNIDNSKGQIKTRIQAFVEML